MKLPCHILVACVLAQAGVGAEPQKAGAAPADTPAKADPIQKLVAELSSTHGMWENGAFQPVGLSTDSSKESVIAAVFKMTGFEKGHVKKHKIIEIRRVRIPGSLPDTYTAAVVETDLGRKIVLLKYSGAALGWWNRVWDEDFKMGKSEK